MKKSFVDTDGETRWFSKKERILYMPYNLDPKEYGDKAKNLIKEGYNTQMEIV